MKVLMHFAVCILLLPAGAMAQRGGHGGGGGGGSHGGGAVGGGFHGGSMGGGGFRGGAPVGGSFGGGFHGGTVVGGFHGGTVVGGFRGGFVNRGFGFRGVGFGGFCCGYPYYGFGYGYGYPYYDDYGYGYLSSSPYFSDYSYGYPAAYSSYPAYSQPYSQPVVNVYNPPPTVYVERANPVLHEYDQYGQPINRQSNTASNNAEPPIYLIATKDHTVQAVLSYSINGSTMEYTTLDHQQKRVQMDEVDRALTDRLNRERHVSFQMP